MISPKIGFISLGCPKATVDSERVLTRLRSEGYTISPSYAEADLVVVNTCGFINAAIEDSFDAIAEALAEQGRVVVTGCLGQRKEFIQQNFPEVIAITGPNDLEAVMTAIHTELPPPHPPHFDLVPPSGLKLTPRHYAYLKIAEGCNQQCRFCVIPQLRGPLVSRPIGEVLDEAEQFVAAGVKEILIIAQDTAAYGVDTRYRLDFWHGIPLKTRLIELAHQLGQFGVWIRLHYLYPYPHLDSLVELMADGLILPYLDVPLQHASPTLLKVMRRPANTENVLQRLEKWRKICPQLTVRSTFIVGFPGETDADFADLLTFLQIAQLDRVGAFTYSPVDGAAANQLPNAVPESLKEERLARLMALQEAISYQKLHAQIGQNKTVLVDEVTPDAIYTRSAGEAPEIDGEIILDATSTAVLNPGAFVNVKITAADAHDQWAVKVL